ncbi:MAG: ASCH domain-containing protein [bacterium]|nr:ASCH domain-containing protein [bacterium]
MKQEKSTRCLDHLKFDPIFLEEVLAGRKLSTVRLGKAKYIPGSEVYLVCRNLVYGVLVIEGVEEKKVGELKEQDAVRDGFKNLEELLKFLFMLYPNLDLDSTVSIIKFKLKKRYSEPVPLFYARLYGQKDTREAAQEILASGVRLKEYDKKILETVARQGIYTAKRKFGTDFSTIHGIIKKYWQRIKGTCSKKL